MVQKILVYILLFLGPFATLAQERFQVHGRVTNTKGTPLEFVNISVQNTTLGTTTDAKGDFRLVLKPDQSFVLQITYMGYKPRLLNVIGKPGDSRELEIILEPGTSRLEEIEISGRKEKNPGFIKLNLKEAQIMPTVSGSIESYLKTLPGVTSNNELSSQYSVRGGNFDENLVYINDIEVYRPFLIRSGRQEGLSIVNSDLASSVKFSSGGFDASYGDKMSSVLDITYRKPTGFGGGFNVSLLGGSVFLEGLSANKKFSWLAGARYKTNQYLLNSLDVTGDYKPHFGDIQTYLSWQVSNKWNIDFLGNAGLNQYHFIPESQRTSFGTLVNAVQLYVLFNGQEKDRFNTWLGALSANFHPSEKLEMKFIASSFTTLEQENYDIEGFYSLNELDKEIGSENMGDSIMNIGIGRFINHARNKLRADVFSVHHKGTYKPGKATIKWGIGLQSELIDDKMVEWKMVDSAGFSIPYDGISVNLSHSVYAENTLNTWRSTAYLLYLRELHLSSITVDFQAGIRSQYWSFNNQLMISPRFSLVIDPDWEKEIQFRVATGSYYQPPFYKEIKNASGVINPDIQAQRSWHFLLGSDLDFLAWNRPFRFTTDLYYKNLSHLIPYKIDNVRIIYSGLNNAEGYATGIEFKINGEFVKGVESWASLSFMRSRERTRTGPEGQPQKSSYYPRPTDQLVNFGLFFQDYFPSNPTFKVYMTLHYSTGIPVTSPNSASNEYFFRMPSYRRVDIGISKVLKDEYAILGDKGIFKYFKTAWVSLEVFNLLGINNTISYTWITTVNNLNHDVGQFAVPNYLTSRRINLKLTTKF